MRASAAHLATDAAGSLAALVAGVGIWVWGWVDADSIASLCTSALVLWAGWRLLRESTHVLMGGTPRGLDPERVRAAIRAVPGVVGVHHLHLWNLSSDVPACLAHVVLGRELSLHRAQAISAVVKASLTDRFGLTNVTLELEERLDMTAAPHAIGPPASARLDHEPDRHVDRKPRMS